MKRIFYKTIMTLGLVVALLTSSCSDFLTKPPITQFTDDDFWVSESTMRAFCWEFYNRFLGYGSGTTADFYWQAEGGTTEMKFSPDLLAASFNTFPTQPGVTVNNWNTYYQYIRKANLILSRVDDIDMLPEAKDHYIGIAKFFRAHCYFSLVSAWGGVPLMLEYLDPEKDKDKIYQPRSDRKIVVDQIIKDLQDATLAVRIDDGSDAVSRDVVYAMLARVALFEGTFRKYHGLGDYTSYLEIAESAAKYLIDGGKYSVPTTGSYKRKYNSQALVSNAEVIFYKRYEKDVSGMMNSIQSHTHSSAPLTHGLTKFSVENYVCSDGLPISQSSLYQGDQGIANVRANRDNRLLDVMYEHLAYEGHTYPGTVIASTTGYATAIWDDPDVAKDSKEYTDYVMKETYNHIDAPLFTITEIYLIYAEAKAELGTLTQTDLDNSVNKLRPRAGLPNLTLVGTDGVSVGGVTINDPKRTATLESTTKGGVVSPIIWEIRRERAAELMGWVQLRHWDIDRWAKGEYMDSNLNPDVVLGAWLGTVPVGQNVILKGGYIDKFPQYSRTFNEKYYLDPLPEAERNLYKDKGLDLTQNPGW